MRKVKSLMLILMGALLAIFFYENWVPAPYIKLFGKEIVQLQSSLMMVLFFVLGAICGLLSHFAWNRSRKPPAEPASRPEEAPEPQSPAQQEEQSQ